MSKSSLLRKKPQRWIIKVGSQLISDGGPLFIASLIHQVKKLMVQHQIEIIWVTSGAIATGRERMGHASKNPAKLIEKQALSAIGQPLIMKLYEDALGHYGLVGAQVLLSYGDFNDKVRRKNLKNTLEQLLKWGALPILNENDTTSTDEIRFGDNDFLSAKVANLLGASHLIMLTDVEGILGWNKKAKKEYLIPELKGLKSLPNLAHPDAKASPLKLGTGGLDSKLKAAQQALKTKTTTWIIQGTLPNCLLKVALKKNPGTRISPI